MVAIAGAQTAVLSAAAWILAGSSSQVVTWSAVASPVIAAAVGAYLTFRLRQVHVLVNNASTMQDRRISQLADALTAAGVDVPVTTQQTGPA
jgi:hypothetical protein